MLKNCGRRLEPPKNVDFITSIPMTRREAFRREVNASELLAKNLAKRWQIPYKKTLKKVRNTPPQATLNRKQRLNNLKGVFQCRDKRGVQNKQMLVVDDIFTTGTTFNQAAACLKQQGARAVRVFALARSGRYADS